MCDADGRSEVLNIQKNKHVKDCSCYLGGVKDSKPGVVMLIHNSSTEDQILGHCRSSQTGLYSKNLDNF